jgi:hypothetical protein
MEPAILRAEQIWVHVDGVRYLVKWYREPLYESNVYRETDDGEWCPCGSLNSEEVPAVAKLEYVRNFMAMAGYLLQPSSIVNEDIVHAYARSERRSRSA